MTSPKKKELYKVKFNQKKTNFSQNNYFWDIFLYSVLSLENCDTNIFLVFIYRKVHLMSLYPQKT